MSTLPSYPYPYFGNKATSVTLTDLLTLLDLHSNYACAICGKSIIAKEGFIEGTDTDAFLLCGFCHHIVGDVSTITEANRDAVYAAYGNIANNAINPEKSDRYGYPWI
jgi:hypothetical protein